MAFTMSYSIDPPEAPKPKTPAAKPVKARPSRARKINDSLAQANALFDHAPTRPTQAETPAPADTKAEPDTTA